MTVAAKSTGSARRWCAGFLRNFSGAAAAEMALIFPIFGYVGINVVDFGMYTFAKMETDLAAQEAVGVVRNLCNSSSLLPATNPATHCNASLTTKMLAAAQSTSLGTAVTLNTPTEAYYCATTAGALVQVAAVTATPPTNCSSGYTGAPSGSTSAPGDYINVQASYTFVSLFPSATLANALHSPITQTAWMRLQ